MSYAVKVVHLMKTKKMSKREAEFQKEAIAQRAASPVTLGKVQKIIINHLPESIKQPVTDTIEQKDKNVEMEIISEGHDKYSVAIKHIVQSFSGYTLEEAEVIKSKLSDSLGKLKGKNSAMEINIVEVVD